jgi:MFS family permease
MSHAPHDVMTRSERRAAGALAGIFALRMLGLFLILPVFALHAPLLEGGASPMWIGIAIGAYGITQACFQLVYGVASDRFGRKPVIAFGLILFILGSVVAALSDTIYGVVIGRVLQGAGAISAAVTALAADLTREHHRTKTMAMIGSSIGLVFAGSLVLAPLLHAVIGLSGLFWLTALLALLAIFTLHRVVPNAPPVPRAIRMRVTDVLRDRQLMRLNAGVFILHLLQTALWVAIPLLLLEKAGLRPIDHWHVYLPSVLIALGLMVPLVIHAERRGRLKPILLGAVLLMTLLQPALGIESESTLFYLVWLTLFFTAFNVLEATQPSWISRLAPPEGKGVALGVYNTLQSLGLFAGGVLGGWLMQQFGVFAIGLLGFGLGLLWFWLSLGLKAPPKPRPKPPQDPSLLHPSGKEHLDGIHQ